MPDNKVWLTENKVIKVKWIITGEDSKGNPFMFECVYFDKALEMYKSLSYLTVANNLTLREVKYND